MRWVRQLLIFLAIALIVANAECVARCSALPCHDPAPASQSDSDNILPCHKHHRPKPDDGVKPCISAAMLVADRGTSGPTIDASQVGVLAVAPSLPFFRPPVPQQLAITEAASPPILAETLFRTVLRI
jgi:hypothetical protein